jgi:hypothetical protein
VSSPLETPEPAEPPEPLGFSSWINSAGTPPELLEASLMLGAGCSDGWLLAYGWYPGRRFAPSCGSAVHLLGIRRGIHELNFMNNKRTSVDMYRLKMSYILLSTAYSRLMSLGYAQQ